MLRTLMRDREQIAAASNPAQEAIWTARGVLDRARKQVEQAAADAVSHRITVLAGDSRDDDSPPSVEQARQKARIAEDVVATARSDGRDRNPQPRHRTGYSVSATRRAQQSTCRGLGRGFEQEIIGLLTVPTT
jgi:hypothetical protein